MYAVMDCRIHVIHKENDGVALARKAGTEYSSGKYIMFVDSDDFLHPDAVQVLYDRINNDKTDMAVGKHVDYYSDGNVNDICCSKMENAVVSREQLFMDIGLPNHVPGS